jgi:LasA protease
MGHLDSRHMGLQRQLTWLANELGNGYYGWRAGTVTELRFGGGLSMRLAPTLNAATVGLHFYFSLDSSLSNWETAIIEGAFLETYTRLFGDPWSYEYFIFEPGVEQPELILPFFPDRIWSFTGGPHGAWERESAWAALDFAPAASESGCVLSEDWVVASAPGQVIRSENGTVVIDLDGDGRENSGWALLYLHVDKDGRVAEGEFVEEGDRLGHPSCEGGTATGTHVHIARKYNGEWILADGPLPFTLSGWIAQAGLRPYQGALVKDGEEVLACPCASQETLIWR